MANKKFSECDLIPVNQISTGDTIWYLDKSDTTGGAGGTIKQAAAENFRNFNTLIASVNYLDLTGIDTSISFFTYIANAINSQGPFTANPGEQFIFFTNQTSPIRTQNTIIKTYYQIYTGNLIVGGSDPANQVGRANIMLSGGPKSLTALNDAEFFIVLGDINTGPVETTFNLGDTVNNQNWVISGEMFITCIINDIDIIYRFIGSAGNYGPTGLTATAADFQDLSTQGEPQEFSETLPIPVKNESIIFDLNNHEYILGVGQANTATSFNTTNEIIGGKLRKKINTPGLTEPKVRTSIIVKANRIITGAKYMIKSIGTTDFTAIGAATNTVGVVFDATGSGSGTGEVYKMALHIGGDGWTSSTDLYLDLFYNGQDVEYKYLGLLAGSSTPSGTFLPLAGGTMTGNTIHNDNVKSIYGTASDAQIYHDSSNFYVKNLVGQLNIDQAAINQSIVFKVSNSNALNTTALIINRQGDLITGAGVTIAGDLTVNGTTTTVNSQTLSVEDPLISLATANAVNSLDIGFYGKYNDGNTRYLGLFNDASDTNKFRLFKGTTVEPTTTVNISGAGYVAADLVVAGLEATTISAASTILSGNLLIGSGEYLSWGSEGVTSIEGSTVSNKLSFRTESVERLLLNSTGATFSGDIESSTAGKGMVLTSPDGTQYKITVANDGTLTSTAV